MDTFPRFLFDAPFICLAPTVIAYNFQHYGRRGPNCVLLKYFNAYLSIFICTKMLCASHYIYKSGNLIFSPLSLLSVICRYNSCVLAYSIFSKSKCACVCPLLAHKKWQGIKIGWSGTGLKTVNSTFEIRKYEQYDYNYAFDVNEWQNAVISS